MSEKIFESTNHWRTNACINPSYVDRWAYIQGFKRAAEIVADEVIRTHAEQDFLVFPIMYNYRHFLELALKDILFAFVKLENEPFEPKRFFGHDLDKLWKKARPQIVAHFPDDDPTQLNIIDEMIKVIHKLDPKGEAFRYNDTALGIHRIGIDTVRFEMTEIAIILDGISMSLSVQIDWQNEMEKYLSEDASWGYGM